MNEVIGTNRDKTVGIVKRIDVYQEFILWSAMPPLEKKRLGIETQNQFCEYYGIGHNTPTPWKQRPDFEDRVDKILRMWAIDKTPDVIQGIYRAAVKGNPMSQLLWLQYFKKFNPKQEIEHSKVVKVEIGPGDVRRLIDLLPEPLRSEHYGNLRKLIDDASAVRNTRRLEDTRWSDRPTLTVHDEADYDAPDVSNDQASPVPQSHKANLRANMVGEISPHHYQSPERWR